MSRSLESRRWRFVLTAVLAGLAMLACQDISEEAKLAEEHIRDSMPTQEFSNVTMIQTREGVKQFILESPHLIRYDKLDKAILYGGVTITFYEDGAVNSVMTADSGEVRQGGDALTAIGNVIVTTDTGTTILTPRLDWNRDTRQIVSDTVVTIITELDTLYGTGLIASDDLKTRQILQPTGVSHRSKRDDGELFGEGDTVAESSGIMSDTLAGDTSGVVISPDSIEGNSVSPDSVDTMEAEADSLLESAP
jgi:LPS export ABC transporter protein LptC